MRVIYESRRLRVSVPNTRSEWFTLLLALTAVAELVRGDANSAWHMLEMGVLLEIAAEVKR